MTDGDDASEPDDSSALGDDAPEPDDLDLSEAEREALHDLQLGIEYVYRAYGDLLSFHHELGHAMDRMAEAEDALREAGHERWADDLRDEHLPAGAVSDQWTFELVEEFSENFRRELDAFEGDVRDELADGIDHVTERRQKRRVRERTTDDRSEGGIDTGPRDRD